MAKSSPSLAADPAVVPPPRVRATNKKSPNGENRELELLAAVSREFDPREQGA